MNSKINIRTMNKNAFLNPPSSARRHHNFSRKKAVIQWLLQEPQDIKFTLIPNFNRFNRPDDFIFSKANEATGMMMGRSLDRLVGQKLIEVLNIHPFHSFFQNYLRAFLYDAPLHQDIKLPLLTRKHKKIVHTAKVVDNTLQVAIKVVSVDITTQQQPAPVPEKSALQEILVKKETISDEKIMQETIQQSEVSTLSTIDTVTAKLAVVEENQFSEVPAEVEIIPSPEVTEDHVLISETVTESLPKTSSVEEDTWAPAIDHRVSQRVSVDGKIEYMNHQICEELELHEYSRQNVFMQDILHKVSQLPYQFALLRAKAMQVVQDLPLIFVTKNQHYVKVMGRIVPQTNDGQVTGIQHYFEVVHSTPHFHKVSSFGKVPAFNTF